MSLEKQLTIKELQRYPPDAGKIQAPPATTEGYATVGQGRGGPFRLHYKTYGQGPTKIVWISGHGVGIDDWYGMMQHFGIKNSNRYTSLIFENRGIGESGGPYSLWSMKDLAQDTKDLLDHLNWTDEGSVNMIGHSMGGMIASQLAITHPTLLKTLTLMSTPTNWLHDVSLWNATRTTLTAIFTSADTSLTRFKTQLHGTAWLTSPDPTGTFPTNGDAFGHRWLTTPPPYKGAVLQAPACVFHRVRSEDLRRVVEVLGRGRVAVVQGKADRIVPVATAEDIVADLGGEEAGVRFLALDGVGHMPMVEREGDVVEFLEGIVGAGHERRET